MTEPLWTTKDLAVYLGKSERMVNRLHRLGRIPQGKNIGTIRHPEYRWNRAAITKWAAS